MQHSMALGLSGQVICWGCNRHGRLGLGLESDADKEVVPLPTRVVDFDLPAKRLVEGEPK